VRPTNVMGASKPAAELVIQALAQELPPTRLAMVHYRYAGLRRRQRAGLVGFGGAGVPAADRLTLPAPQFILAAVAPAHRRLDCSLLAL